MSHVTLTRESKIETNKMTNTLKSYIRNPETNAPEGVVVIVSHGDHYHLGHSLAHPKLDKFDKERGTTIAINRALKTERNRYSVPDLKDRQCKVGLAYLKLLDRAEKYFEPENPRGQSANS